VWFRSRATLSGTTLAAGQKALLLIPDENLKAYAPVLKTELSPFGIRTWPFTPGGTISIGDIPVMSVSGPYPRAALTLQTVRDYIRRYCPEHIDLSKQAMDAVLFPDRLEDLRASDPGRAHYVAMMATVLDIERDAPALSALLESPEATIRAAAEQRLAQLGSPAIVRPASDSPAALHLWSAEWQEWGDEQRKARVRFWPPIPDSYQLPEDLAPAALTDALERSDEGAFAKAFRTWVDSGAARDRSIAQARTLSPDDPLRSCCGAMAAGVFASGARSARDRFYAIANFVSQRSSAQFVEEQGLAKPSLSTADPCSEEIRRAAFWEPTPDGHSYLRPIAVDRLFSCPDEAASKELLKMYLNSKPPGIDPGLATRYQHGDTLVEKTLFEAAGAGCDSDSAWVSRTLALAGDSRVIPLLVKCLSSPDSNGRVMASWNLAEIPSADAVDALLAAIRAEADPTARGWELAALGEIGSPKALDTLLAAANQPSSAEPSISVVRGLARIRDPRALGTLATIALGAKTGSRLQWESVSAFGFVSKLYQGFPPATIRVGGMTHPDIVKLALPIMADWLKAHLQ
jgi:hypothetical protein